MGRGVENCVLGIKSFARIAGSRGGRGESGARGSWREEGTRAVIRPCCSNAHALRGERAGSRRWGRRCAGFVFFLLIKFGSLIKQRTNNLDR